MIKIDKIGKQEARISINKIEQSYLKQVKKDYNPFTKLEESINKNSLVTHPTPDTLLSQDERDCLIYLRDNYDNLVIGKPAQLESHIVNINAINPTLFGSDQPSSFGMKFTTKPFGKGLYMLFGYDSFRSKQKKGIWFAKQLHVRSCPYCNAQYTLTIRNGRSSHKAKFQFDHFYSKKRYPFLSISMYNLIPSCAPCNLNKGDRQTTIATHYHPYVLNLASLTKFKLKYDFVLSKLSLGDLKKLDMKIEYNSKYTSFNDLVKRHNDLFEIENTYQAHLDIAEDMLHKAIVNNSAFKKDILAIKGLFGGDSSLYNRYLIGNYSIEDDILQRPLSKLTQDLASQLEII